MAKETLTNLTLGEMPKPQYIDIGANEKWIGMKAYSVDKEIKDFLWWTNCSFRKGIDYPRDRYELASYMAINKLCMNADFAIGLPIDLEESMQQGRIMVVENPKLYGIYIEENKRMGFTFMASMLGMKTEGQLRRSKPVEFDEIFQKAKEVIPRVR